MVRLPTEAGWEAAIGGRGAYPWGARFDPTRLNCAESWTERRFSNHDEWLAWFRSDTESRREASTTAVTTYSQGVSKTGVWDGIGNVWEWMDNPYAPSDDEMARGGAWNDDHRDARVSTLRRPIPVYFSTDLGVRVVVGPVLT
jgi:formylglycine-generating enzyme required for sulfatase activity